MSQHSVIEMTFKSKIFGKTPNGAGVFTRTIIRFADRDGRMTALDAHRREACQMAQSAYDRAMAVRGYRRRYWLVMERQARNREYRITRRAWRHAMKLLRKAPEKISLKTVWLTTAGARNEVDSSGAAVLVLESLKSAEELRFNVLKPA